LSLKAREPTQTQNQYAMTVKKAANTAVSGVTASPNVLKVLSSMMRTYSGMAVRIYSKPITSATVKRENVTITVQANARLDVAELQAQSKVEAEALAKDELAQIARRRRIAESHFKNVMLAMHGYHDANKHLPPPAICDRNTGKPLLSWRVLILPYLDEFELFNQFKLDEPWDSAHNIKLLPRMPKLYAPMGVKTKAPHSTFIQALVGPDTCFPTLLNKDRQIGAVGVSLLQITDGSSNTFGVVEAFDAVPWSKPADLVYDSKKPLPRMGGTQFESGFHAGFMDGTVRFVNTRVDEKTLRAFITRAGNELSDFNKLERD